MQGPDTDRRVVAEIAHSLREQRPVTATLLNYRQDGGRFWNELSISPVRDRDGTVTHFVGIQADVTARVEAQQARDDALSQVALAADRLALLADVTSRMARCQVPQQVIELLAEVLVPRVGSWAMVFTKDDAGRLQAPLVQHERAASDPDVRDVVASLLDVLPEQILADSPVWRVLRGDQPYVLVEDYDTEPRSVTGAADDERTALLHKLGLRSAVAVPLLARNSIIGCVVLGADSARPRFGDSDLVLIRDLSARAALMLENTQLYARERAAASTLQRSLLPRVPRIPGVEVAAVYVPSDDEAAVGGDWYDVFALRDRSAVGVVVGDVMGHNFDSAARMGKLSTVVRSYAWPGREPSAVLTGVDELLEGTDLDLLATCLYVRLTPHADGTTLQYSSAGHPPAILRAPDGTASTLDAGRGPMIGVSALTDPARPRIDATVRMPRGGTLICFTDGLVDTFADEPDLDVGLHELCRLTEQLPVDASPQAIVDRLTGTGRRQQDDVAVVAIRIG